MISRRPRGSGHHTSANGDEHPIGEVLPDGAHLVEAGGKERRPVELVAVSLVLVRVCVPSLLTFSDLTREGRVRNRRLPPGVVVLGTLRRIPPLRPDPPGASRDQTQERTRW